MKQIIVTAQQAVIMGNVSLAPKVSSFIPSYRNPYIDNQGNGQAHHHDFIFSHTNYTVCVCACVREGECVCARVCVCVSVHMHVHIRRTESSLLESVLSFLISDLGSNSDHQVWQQAPLLNNHISPHSHKLQQQSFRAQFPPVWSTPKTHNYAKLEPHFTDENKR